MRAGKTRGRLNFLQTTHPLYRALYFAESLEPSDLMEASLELDRMPALDRRKLLARWGAMFGYKAQRDAEGK
jgi:hypothetical protein